MAAARGLKAKHRLRKVIDAKSYDQSSPKHDAGYQRDSDQIRGGRCDHRGYIYTRTQWPLL